MRINKQILPLKSIEIILLDFNKKYLQKAMCMNLKHPFYPKESLVSQK